MFGRINKKLPLSKYKFMPNLKYLPLVLAVGIFVNNCSTTNELVVSNNSNFTSSKENSVQTNENTLKTVKMESSNVRANVTTAKTDQTEQYELCCLEGVKGIILKKLRENWTDKSGTEYKLTKKSEQKMLGILLPAAENQYNLSYSAQNSKRAEEISEVNVTKKITTVDGKVTKVVKTVALGEGDKLFNKALVNIKTQTEKLAKIVNGQQIVAADGTTSVITDSKQNINEILMSVHESAISKVDELMKSLMKSEKF